MNDLLLAAIGDYTGRHADGDGAVRTPIPGLTLLRAEAPTGLEYAIVRPMVAIVVQGAKHVAMGTQAFTFSAGDSLLITADVPTVSQITAASPQAPYLAVVLELDPALIAELLMEIDAAPTAHAAAIRVEPTDAEVAAVALRMIQVLARPAAVSLLHGPLLREMHYWLLAGQHGPAIRRLGWPDSHLRRVARAVALIREATPSACRSSGWPPWPA